MTGISGCHWAGLHHCLDEVGNTKQSTLSDGHLNFGEFN